VFPAGMCGVDVIVSTGRFRSEIFVRVEESIDEKKKERSLIFQRTEERNEERDEERKNIAMSKEIFREIDKRRQ
jgi:hypothetical protein